MSSSVNPAERLAGLGVDGVRAVKSHSVAASVIGLVLAAIVSLSYVLLGSLGINPLRPTMSVKVLLRESGGLMVNQNVTLRGVSIGRVTAVNFTTTGVEATADINGDVRVPRDSKVSVSALSPAGEQYLNFVPQQSGGPALADGAVIGEDQTSVPVPLAQVLSSADGLLAQIDPDKLRVITDELRVSGQGPQKLAALLDGGAFLISTVGSVLPETMSVLRTSPTVLTTLSDAAPALSSISHNMKHIMAGVNRAEGGFRTLVDRGAAPITVLDAIIDDNSDTMVQLLGNLTTVVQVLSARTAALHEMLRTDRPSTLGTFSTLIHDGGVWLSVDAYPRYACDYKLPHLPAWLPNYPEPFLYTYCDNPDPAVLVRGARNAPRPPGDDTAGPPPGWEKDPLAVTPPTPQTKWTIPTPFGGSTYPVALPPDPPDWPVPPGWPGKEPDDNPVPWWLRPYTGSAHHPN